ncbi:MAG TPA: hypothetical protein VGW98_04035 [Solirubrobacteraceae bacterium]|nr:hypothetical protein [Solirubrobacteraceae bacterium]
MREANGLLEAARERAPMARAGELHRSVGQLRAVNWGHARCQEAVQARSAQPHVDTYPDAGASLRALAASLGTIAGELSGKG